MISTMKRAVAVLLGIAMAVACGDAPVAPSRPNQVTDVGPSLGKRSSGGETVPVLERTRALREIHSTTVVVGPEGGEIALPKTGFRMRIPAGALAVPTAISATAYKGKAVAYEFGPHGLQFLAPVVVEQDLAGTTAERNADIQALLSAGYYAGGTTSIDDSAGTAVVSERMPARLSNDLTSVMFDITHFSGYIIATGRSDATTVTR